MHQQTLTITTQGRGLYDITRDVRAVVAKSGVTMGLCTLFVQHTSASLLIQENADPAVLRDLETWFARIAPESAKYEHDDEGPDDMPSHLRSAVTRTSESIPIGEGKLVLGTWQAIYLYEHRTAGHERRVVVHLIG